MKLPLFGHLCRVSNMYQHSLPLSHFLLLKLNRKFLLLLEINGVPYALCYLCYNSDKLLSGCSHLFLHVWQTPIESTYDDHQYAYVINGLDNNFIKELIFHNNLIWVKMKTNRERIRCVSKARGTFMWYVLRFRIFWNKGNMKCQTSLFVKEIF